MSLGANPGEAQVLSYLADTSAWHCSRFVKEYWEKLISSDRVATCPIVALEYLFSAKSSKEYPTLLISQSTLTNIPLTPEVGQRAIEVQSLLSKKHQMGHRATGPADLLIAACAELSNLIVLHYDQDFDLIAEVTGQPCEWIAPRGTLESD